MKAVAAEHLSKVYAQGKKAVNDVSFSLEAGEIFGFLGPNGAGKTTTVKLLNGILRPSEGVCRVFDMDPALAPEAVHEISGVVTEHAQMYDHMTGQENLLFYGALFGVGPKESGERAKELLDRLDLAGAKEQKLATYSTGMRQRLSLARAMIHSPRILFLDEPTAGLDPESAKNVNELMKQLARESGTTVFLCTHQLRYAQEVCTRYGLVDEGILFAQGSIDELRASVSTGMAVTIKADRFPRDLALQPKENGLHEISVASESEIPHIVKRIIDEGGKVYHVSARRPTLEELYFALIERRKQGREGGI